MLEVWNRLVQQGDIYLGDYSGWYSSIEESFLAETQVPPLCFFFPSNLTQVAFSFSLSGEKIATSKTLGEKLEWVLFPSSLCSYCLMIDNRKELHVSIFSIPRHRPWMASKLSLAYFPT